MKRHGIPLTRENYIHAAFAGNVPETLDAETEAQFPEQFRRHSSLGLGETDKWNPLPADLTVRCNGVACSKALISTKNVIFGTPNGKVDEAQVSI